MKKMILTVFTFLLSAATFATPRSNDLIQRLRNVDSLAYRMAVEEMQTTWKELKISDEWQPALQKVITQREELCRKIKEGDKRAISDVEALLSTLDYVLLQNPLIKDKPIYMIERTIDNARKALSGNIGLAPSNFQNNSEIHNPASGWNNKIISYNIDKAKVVPVLSTPNGTILTDVEPHFSGEKFLYSSIGTNGKWHIFEYNLLTGQSHQVTPEEYRDFDSFDACYTPDGKIIFCSTATFLGLPCTNGENKMCGLFQYDPQTGKSRQLTFDQDSNWGPTLMENGQIMYTRWEYADLPHSNSRILFTMNPDGSLQRAYYGSGSYFPTSLFDARPIPSGNGRFVATVSGHHSISRSGMLMIFDPQKGDKEANGVVTEIPHRDRKVEPIVRDRQNDGIWPQFLHPFPLSDKYFLVSMKQNSSSLWGVYLVDIYNNMTLIAQAEGQALLEPKIIQPTKVPYSIPSALQLASDSATMFIQDVYFGEGLKGIPRGEVKKMRIGGFDFSPRMQGGLLGTIGLDGPWDIKRIFGEVDVEEDGSVMCVIPANTPIFLQPLDSEGKALQVMRSWFTAMPGEFVSCTGCHEERSAGVPPRMTAAFKKAPAKMKQMYGEERGLSFEREIQPILDRNCVGCHDGTQKERPLFKKGVKLTDWSSAISGRAGTHYGGKFTESYYQLQRYVRRPGIESDMAMLTPMDVHADQTELFQILNQGHFGVKLNQKEIELLAMWIDFNAPYFGRRSDIATYDKVEPYIKLKEQYASLLGYKHKDVEVIAPDLGEIEFIKPPYLKSGLGDTSAIEGWPRYRGEEINNYSANDQVGLSHYHKSLDLGGDVKLDLVKIPTGEYHMGSERSGEHPISRQNITKAFWIGQFEITNEQYALFDSLHDSRTEHRHGYQFGRIGYPLNEGKQPVVRISWFQAMAFCEWLSEKTGLKVTLPSEMEWEWAARSGSATAYPFGDIGVDYTKYANLGDQTLKEFAACTAYKFYESWRVIDNPNRYDDWIPRDTLFDDRGFVSTPVGNYRPNAWEIFDMNGNVAEWTRSEYLPYPYDDVQANNTKKEGVKRVVRGGSWYDRPHKGTSSFRIGYRDYQPLFNVGFRVVIHEDDSSQ
ncbi:MAG: SUMF1/EgtB/PvdO family nonheme iron enzyme [Phocaeicola sp.]